MTSIKVKFRQSTSEGCEGKIYFQIIHDRIVRQWYSDYKIFSNEWDSKKSAIVISSDTERRAYLQSVRARIKWDKKRFNRIITEFSSKDSYTADEIVEEFVTRQNQQSFFNFMENVIIRLKELGKLRTSQTYTSALNSFRGFKKDEDVVFDGFDSDLMESLSGSSH